MGKKPNRCTVWLVVITLLSTVVLLTFWGGVQASLIHERKALIAEGLERGFWVARFDDSSWSIWNLLGDRRVPFITIRDDVTPRDRARLKRAFPEATIEEWGPRSFGLAARGRR